MTRRLPPRRIACLFVANKANMSERDDHQPPPVKGGRPLIFVVDDEQLLLEFVMLVLEPEGYEIRTFREPAQALEAFRTAAPRPDLVVVDYAMPAMTGMTLMGQCRALQPDQKFLLVSGTVRESVFAEAADRPDGFLAKPYQPRQLVSQVRKLVGR
jgi:CheY-like chemotaxis protein